MIKTFESSTETIIYNEILSLEPSIIKELEKSKYKIMAISLENFQEFYKNKDIKGYYDFFKKNYL